MNITSENHLEIAKELHAEDQLPQGLLELNEEELAQFLTHLSKEAFQAQIKDLIALPKFIRALLAMPASNLLSWLDLFTEVELIQLLNTADQDDAIDILSLFDEHIQESLLLQLKDKKLIRHALSYPEGSCGRELQPDFFSLNIGMTAGEALKDIQNRAQDELIYYIYCLTHKNKLIGVVSLKEIALSKASTPLDDLVKRDLITVTPKEPIRQAIEKTQVHDLIALPVVTETYKMLGLITVDDVVDLIEEKATADIYAHAGLNQIDSVASKPHYSFAFRLPWLLLNLGLAALASWVISQFEATITETIALASLMHIVAALGGNTAIQTLTVVTRGLATGEFKFISIKKALIKELIVGVSLGFVVGFCAFFLAWLWKGNVVIAGILWVSMVLNAFVAASFGSLVPIMLKRLNRDPAVGSGVLVTTATDIFSFFSFLGISSLGLAWFS